MRAGWTAVALGISLLAMFTLLLLLGQEPFATWFYLFAWYPVLLAADGVVALSGGAGRKGEFLLLSRPRHLASVLFWSAVIWLFYELFNFRLQNWYYVNVPADRAVRWSFTVVAFATVLPAVFLSERILGGFGIAERMHWRALRLTPRRLHAIQGLGLVFLALVLVWPRYFFPLVWGATTLFVEPIVYRRAPDRSILGDLERGEPGRLVRLLLGGMAIGLTWEMLNIRARAKWIYTVPGLEDVKLFEMPVLGFFGFPPFALECFVLWQALVLAGLAVPRTPDARIASRPLVRRLGHVAAVAFSLLVLAGMDGGRTWDSFRPELHALDAVPADVLERAGYDVFTLAEAEPGEVARAAGASEEEARQWIESARLATLRGIGAEHARQLRALGIHDVSDLAATDADTLSARLEPMTTRPVLPARVRVWVRGARSETGN